MLKDYSAYNHWANAEIVNWLKKQPKELMESEVPSSFPNLKLTLLHIWAAEKVWLERLTGTPPTAFLSQTFNGSTAEVFEGLLAQSAAFEAFVKSLEEEKLDEICPFTLLNGTSDSRKRSEMIHHCMNHSSYHRGQIVTMARSLGLTDPPQTDFIKYLRVR